MKKCKRCKFEYEPSSTMTNIRKCENCGREQSRESRSSKWMDVSGEPAWPKDVVVKEAVITRTKQTMYASLEIPKQCTHCHHTESECYHTNRTAHTVHRYRKCRSCGKNWTSRTPV